MAKNFLVPLNMNGLEIQNFLAHNLAAAPTGVKGKIYYNTADNKLYYYNGTAWVDLTANAITGVKGNAESAYRTGQVNLTPANVGAAPTSHASTATTYGMGTSANYGHVKLSDATNATTAAASGGTAATPKAVKDALDAAKTYADGIVAASDAMVFKGTLGTGGTITTLPSTDVKVGDTYRVITAGTYDGHSCEIGDLIIAISSEDAGDELTEWAVAQTNITGINKTTASIGSASAGTAIAADDITAWSAGTVPTLGTAIPADDITAWSAGTAASASYADGVLTITNGTAPSLSYTAKSIPNVTNVGTAPSLSYTARSIPNISVTSKTVVTDVAFTTD